MREVAQQYINQGLQPIPLSKDGDGKGTNIKGWDTTAFTAGHFNEDNNIGLKMVQQSLSLDLMAIQLSLHQLLSQNFLTINGASVIGLTQLRL